MLEDLGLTGGYFLFVGRFIPDKGLQTWCPRSRKTGKKLVLVGGAPNPSEFEPASAPRTRESSSRASSTGQDARADEERLRLLQPSDVEGLSPVILENMGLGMPGFAAISTRTGSWSATPPCCSGVEMSTTCIPV